MPNLVHRSPAADAVDRHAKHQKHQHLGCDSAQAAQHESASLFCRSALELGKGRIPELVKRCTVMQCIFDAAGDSAANHRGQFFVGWFHQFTCMTMKVKAPSVNVPSVFETTTVKCDFEMYAMRSTLIPAPSFARAVT